MIKRLQGLAAGLISTGVPAENFAHRSQAMTEDEKVVRLADMGFSKEAAIVALSTANGDENAAVELLLAAI